MNKNNQEILNFIKESKEDRLERIHTSATYTRIVESKKVYNRKKLKPIKIDD